MWLMLLLLLLLLLYLLALFSFLFLILALPLSLPLLPLGLLLCLLLLFFPLLLLCLLLRFLPWLRPLSLPFSPSPLPPTPASPSPMAPPASSFPSSSSLSASATLRPPPGFAPLPPPPPPGFAPLLPSLSPPLSSPSFPSASAVPSVSSSLPPSCLSFSAGLAPPVLSSSSSSFPQLDFASYQASMLGLSQDYQSLARWYFLSGGSDFRAYLSVFYPHLSSDASRDFSSGSSVFFSALRSVASSVPLPTVSSGAPLPLVASASSTRTPAPLPLPAPVSAPYGVTVPPLSLPPVSQLGGGGCMHWVLHRYCLRLLQVFLLSLLPRLFFLCLLLQFLLPLFLLPGLRVSRGSILLPPISCLRLP